MTACDLLILHGSVKDPCGYLGAVFSGICHSVIKMYSSTISKTIEFSVKPLFRIGIDVALFLLDMFLFPVLDICIIVLRKILIFRT